MIKNERQYRVTRSQASAFASALEKVRASNSTSPLLKQLEVDSLVSQVEQLNQELHEYELLRSGQKATIAIDSFETLPDALIQARIASGLSQKDLAEAIGVQEQQIQRYEATSYAAASFSRLSEIVKALGVKLQKGILLTLQPTVDAFYSRLGGIGISKDFLLNKLLPRSLAARLQSEQHQTALLQAASYVERVFGFAADVLFGQSPLALGNAASLARFKLPANAASTGLAAYVSYSHFIASVAAETAVDLPNSVVPSDATDFRKLVLARHPAINFASVISTAWDLGVVTIPLSASGLFHAAFWRIKGRNAIVLKQTNTSPARWLHDLLHELYHASQEPEAIEREVIELEEMSPERRGSEEEEQANLFAGDVMLDGRAESLAEECVAQANGSVERLKNAVITVATKEGVQVAALANYMAFRLGAQGINWWGAASNLQTTDEVPTRIAHEMFFRRANLSRLNEPDRDLLLQALSVIGD